MTTSGSYDFTGYQVLVVGGTRGEGHAIATSFAANGASVTVTGTMMLRSLYDTDLSAFDYESVNLARQDSIDHLAATVDQIDVLVLAATCNLPYGLQRRLEIARALASRPRLLLLDEPAAGMNPTETVALMELIRRIRDTGVTVLLIEHHMRVVMGVSDRICVLNFGKRIAEGTPEQIRNDPACIEAYLGREELG